MNAEEIGTLAGKVWALLNEKPMTAEDSSEDEGN